MVGYEYNNAARKRCCCCIARQLYHPPHPPRWAPPFGPRIDADDCGVFWRTYMFRLSRYAARLHVDDEVNEEAGQARGRPCLHGEEVTSGHALEVRLDEGGPRHPLGLVGFVEQS
ncbi:MAG: hypothetical protein FWD61_07525, partial [Phycisphaerales bacterium]|nr:hypothetical protein [Phycisphaerales bacterium]